jgi:hypothetical protein
MPDADHFIRASRGSSNAQHSIALFQKPDCDRMKNLVEKLVSDFRLSGKAHQRESQPFS